MTALAPYLTSYLRDHLPRERNASPHTVSTYAHAFALLVRFAADRLKCRPSDLTVEDMDTELILAFLDHVEAVRSNAARSRNARFAAIRSFFRYLEYTAPTCLDQALRIRSLPTKRTDKALIDYLTKEEMQVLLDAPNPRTPGGTRDRAMLHLTYACGLRVSELLSLRLTDFPERSLATVHIIGKGRRERVLPLWRETQSVMRAWLAIRPDVLAPEVFLNRDREPMTRDGFVETAAKKRPSILGKHVTPHVLRHSCAMHTLAATGDIRKVSLWLGHASLESTEAYLHADPAEKLAVLAAHSSPTVQKGKFRGPSDKLLAMLAQARASAS